MRVHCSKHKQSCAEVDSITAELAHLLGQIVIDDEGMFSVVPEVLSHGTAGVGGEVLQGGCVRRCGTHHDGVLHSICNTATSDRVPHTT